MTTDDYGLQGANVRIGTKQTMKLIEQGSAIEVFVAQDADPRMVSRVAALCKQRDVKLTHVPTMSALGKACGIEVGAAMVALIRE